MTSFTTFYLSRIIGKKVFDSDGKFIGIVKDLLVSSTLGRPLVNGIKIKSSNRISFYSFQYFQIEKKNGKIKVTCYTRNRISR